MVKDPLDNDRTMELPLEPVPEAEPEFKPTVSPEAVEKALAEIRGRSFSGRHPELGKMIKCQVCGLRHRQNERKCEQKFTHVVNGQEVFIENEEGELIPDLRTAIRPDEKPTKRQQLGAAYFNRKRRKPHLSKIKLQFVQRVRQIFAESGFYLLDETTEKFKDLTPEVQEKVREYFQEDLHRVRVIAARQLRRERELSDREWRRRQDTSRRINRGLL